MNELKEQPQQTTDSIYVSFSFIDGNMYTQEIYMKDAHMVEELLKWYRDSKQTIWTFNYAPVSKIALFNKAHIMSLEIDGYIELARTDYKWHEKLLDKIRTKWIMRKL